jgi:hypothetical protein
MLMTQTQIRFIYPHHTFNRSITKTNINLSKDLMGMFMNTINISMAKRVF